MVLQGYNAFRGLDEADRTTLAYLLLHQHPHLYSISADPTPRVAVTSPAPPCSPSDCIELLQALQSPASPGDRQANAGVQPANACIMQVPHSLCLHSHSQLRKALPSDDVIIGAFFLGPSCDRAVTSHTA